MCRAFKLGMKVMLKNNERHHDFPIGNTYSSLKIINNFELNINFEDELKSVCFEKSEVFH